MTEVAQVQQVRQVHFLEPGTQTVGSAVRNDVVVVASIPETMGRLHVKGTSITFEPAPGVTVTRTGETLKSAGEETYATTRFNPYTTCPIPVKDSIVPVKVLAGEKAYPIHVSIPEPTK